MAHDPESLAGEFLSLIAAGETNCSDVKALSAQMSLRVYAGRCFANESNRAHITEWSIVAMSCSVDNKLA
jgi:hypothetical protein